MQDSSEQTDSACLLVLFFSILALLACSWGAAARGCVGPGVPPVARLSLFVMAFTGFWFFATLRATLTPLHFDASFDDRSFPPSDSAYTGTSDFACLDDAQLVLGDSSLELPQDAPDFDVAPFVHAHAQAPYQSVFRHTPQGEFPPTQPLRVLTNELLSTHGEYFGSRLSSRRDRWVRSDLRIPPAVHEILDGGIRFRFPRGPPQSFHFENAPSLQPGGSPQHIAFVDAQIVELLGIGAIQDIGSFSEVLTWPSYFLNALLVVEQGPPSDPGSPLRLCPAKGSTSIWSTGAYK